MKAQNIDEVISQLESIIHDSIKLNNRAGYFAALYHKVTCRVKEGILAGEFEDGPRMELLDVIFANRYLAAYDQWTNKRPTPSSWKIAFEMFDKPKVLVLQHLLLGMNAHINLDLGIAVAEVAKAQNQPIQQLHKDFNLINAILAELTHEVIDELDRVAPLLFLTRLHSENDSLLMQFAMSNARDGAWCFSEDLFTKEGAEYSASIEQRDKDIYKLGKSIIEVKDLLRMTVFVIHVFGHKKPSKIIGFLNNSKKASSEVKN